MTECVVFMDGLHSRVKDNITLTLSVENPIICKMQRLASMECTSEDTENVTIILQNFLAILCKSEKGSELYVEATHDNKRAVGKGPQ